MNEQSQNLSLVDVQNRIAELDAIVDNFGAPPAGATAHQPGDAPKKAKDYSPKAGHQCRSALRDHLRASRRNIREANYRRVREDRRAVQAQLRFLPA